MKYDKQADDEMLGIIRDTMLANSALGILEPPPDSFLFRLTWLCRKCSELHMVRGDVVQIQSAATAFMLWNYPYFTVMPESFCVLMESEGRSFHDPKALMETAPEYTEFLARTRG